MDGTWSFLFLLSGVVGARNLTMECRKGRRKGSPILVGLLLAWLLTNGCAVVARNIGECEKVFTILDRGFLPRVNSPPSPTELAPIKAGYNGARIFTRDTSGTTSRGGATRHKQKPVLHLGTFRMFSLTSQRARFESVRNRCREIMLAACQDGFLSEKLMANKISLKRFFFIYNKMSAYVQNKN